MSGGDLTTKAGGREEAAEIAQAKRRDRATWAAWHDRYFPPLYRYAYARLLNAEEAEDIASQVFLEALKGIDRFRYQGRPILAWLYGIANNLILKRRRQLARSPLMAVEADADPAGAVEEEEAAIQRLLVSYALERLKKEHRQVLVLRYLFDMSTREVARAMNKSEQATYSLLFRALQAAHAILASDVEAGKGRHPSRRQVA